MSRRSGAWAGLLVGAAMAAAPLVPAPAPDPVGVGAVPAAGRSRPAATGIDLFRVAASPAPRPEPSDPPPGPPLRLQLPTLGVDAVVTPVDADDGELAIPDDPRVVGWWRGGAAPGADAGSVVLAGHVDTWAAGPGALFRVAALRPGDRIVLGTAAGDRGYDVAAVRAYPKARLPADVFDTAGSPRLVLVTCGGPFDRRTRHYADNVVAYAVPA